MILRRSPGKSSLLSFLRLLKYCDSFEHTWTNWTRVSRERHSMTGFNVISSWLFIQESANIFVLFLQSRRGLLDPPEPLRFLSSIFYRTVHTARPFTHPLLISCASLRTLCDSIVLAEFRLVVNRWLQRQFHFFKLFIHEDNAVFNFRKSFRGSRSRRSWRSSSPTLL